MIRIMGIDVGITGGIAVIEKHDNGMEAVMVRVMPTMETDLGNELDYSKLYSLINAVDIVYIEKQGPMPKNGVKQAFRFGGQFYALRCIVHVLGKRVVFVLPQRWKKEMLSDMNKKQKNSSITKAKQLFPDINLLRTEKCTKEHDGMAEALLIAEYGRRKEKL